MDLTKKNHTIVPIEMNAELKHRLLDHYNHLIDYKPKVLTLEESVLILSLCYNPHIHLMYIGDISSKFLTIKNILMYVIKDYSFGRSTYMIHNTTRIQLTKANVFFQQYAT